MDQESNINQASLQPDAAQGNAEPGNQETCSEVFLKAVHLAILRYGLPQTLSCLKRQGGAESAKFLRDLSAGQTAPSASKTAGPDLLEQIMQRDSQFLMAATRKALQYVESMTSRM